MTPDVITPSVHLGCWPCGTYPSAQSKEQLWPCCSSSTTAPHEPGPEPRSPLAGTTNRVTEQRPGHGLFTSPQHRDPLNRPQSCRRGVRPGRGRSWSSVQSRIRGGHGACSSCGGRSSSTTATGTLQRGRWFGLYIYSRLLCRSWSQEHSSGASLPQAFQVLRVPLLY